MNAASGDRARSRAERAAVVGAARQLWQAENRALSTQAELVWGDSRDAGKTLDLVTLIASDRANKRAWSGAELCLMAGVPYPRANGHDKTARAPPRPDWLGEALVNKSADPYPNLYNTVLALENDAEFANRIAFDEMLRQPVIAAGGEAGTIPVEDDHLIALQRMLQAKGLPKVPINTVHDAVRFVARRNNFHPLKDRLDGLRGKHDGTPRLANWLKTYVGAPDDEYYRVVGTCFLVAMMARIYKPGCKADYMLVLEGPQGEEKSRLIKALACGYYSDHLPNLESDPIRLSQHLRGKWLIEVSEMEAFSKAEATRLKAFITRPEEIYTPKYARNEVHEPRQCLFIGTTNKSAYLRDETGGRRFWPVKCGKIDVLSLERDLDQLLAEALDAYESDAQWWPDRKFELEFIKPMQDQRYERDAWADKIEQHFKVSPDTHTTIMYVAKAVLEFATIDRLGKADQNRIIACLELLGWTRGNRQASGNVWLCPSKPLL
jgi:predicted P-loop ATPase